VDYSKLKPGVRVELRADTNNIHRIIPTKVDPLLFLMMVQKVPDSTYAMIGRFGLTNKGNKRSNSTTLLKSSTF
jgi:ATP-dependent 26S proteasome regulatory subunit